MRAPVWEATLGPRFVVKFTNGQWTIFDRADFKVVEVAGTRKEIDRIYVRGPRGGRK